MSEIKLETELKHVLADDLTLEQERTTVEAWVRKNPQAAAALLPVLVTQKHQYKQALADLQAKLRQSPWHAATFLCMLAPDADRALVAIGNRRSSVALGQGLRPEDLQCGATVLLNSDMKILLSVAGNVSQTGEVGSIARFHDGRVVLKTPGDAELVADVSSRVRDEIQEGDAVLFDRESLIVFEKIDRDNRPLEILTEVDADIDIAHLGGLDSVFDALVDELTLHLFHRDIAEKFRLSSVKGVLLVGPPGVGKTSLVKALARHFTSQEDIRVKLLLAKPGVHRSMWFGMSEQRIRGLFDEARNVARRAGQFVFLFFDDMDQLGARDDRSVNAIDARLLPCFLQEIDRLQAADRILLIGSTNRPDLLDEALLRSGGRFGDRVFRIPRPSRAAAREILLKMLTPDLPYYPSANGNNPVESIVAQVLAGVFAPNGEQHTLATLTFRDGSRHTLTAPQVLSGAVLANVVAEAKRCGCLRALRGGPQGLTAPDLLKALDNELVSIAHRLKPGPALTQMLDLSPDLDVVRVDVHPSRKAARSHEYQAFGRALSQ